MVEKSPKSNRHRRVDLTAELAEALEKIQHGGSYAHLAPGESAGYMHLLATEGAPTAPSSGPASGPARLESELN